MGRKKKSNGLEMFLRLTSMPVSKKDLVTMFPDISQITIERTLRRMCASGDIEMVGSKRLARYIRKR